MLVKVIKGCVEYECTVATLFENENNGYAALSIDNLEYIKEKQEHLVESVGRLLDILVEKDTISFHEVVEIVGAVDMEINHTNPGE